MGDLKSRTTNHPGGPWRGLVSFRIRNPARPVNQPWRAEVTPIVKRTKGLDFALGELSLKNRNDRDSFWNHTVNLLLRVQANGVTLTNWSAAHIEAEDASGNWDYLGTLTSVTNDWVLHEGWRGLDPRFLWKLEVDFSPASQFAAESLFRFQVPVSLPKPIQTNFADLPLEIDWVNQRMLSVKMLTNREDLRLLFVAANDDTGQNLDDWTGSWGQASFWRSLKLEGTNQLVNATIAIVPNVHVTYYVQPTWVEAGQPELAH